MINDTKLNVKNQQAAWENNTKYLHCLFLQRGIRRSAVTAELHHQSASTYASKTSEKRFHVLLNHQVKRISWTVLSCQWNSEKYSVKRREWAPSGLNVPLRETTHTHPHTLLKQINTRDSESTGSAENRLNIFFIKSSWVPRSRKGTN